MQSVAKGSSDHNEGLPNDNNEVDRHNGANENVSVNKIAEDVQTIARFLIVNEDDQGINFVAAESIYDAVMKALDEHDSEIDELKARVADLEAQMRSEMND